MKLKRVGAAIANPILLVLFVLAVLNAAAGDPKNSALWLSIGLGGLACESSQLSQLWNRIDWIPAAAGFGFFGFAVYSIF